MAILLGTWKLIDASAFDVSGNELTPPLGQNPRGLILYENERMMVVVCDGSTTVSPEAAQRAFISYTGSYQFDGKILVVHVDDASSPDLFVDQACRINFENPDRHVAVPLSPEGQSPSLKLTWQRIGN
jgi:hypothetical protein